MKWDLVNTTTRERIGGRCKAYRCAYCGPRKLKYLELCLCAAMPERFLTLTLAPEDPTQRRKQVAWLMQSVRRGGRRCELAWCTERNPKGTGFHIHALQKGDFIPQRELQAKWGGRRVDIRQVKSVGSGVQSYMLKVQAGAIRAAGYTLKAQEGRLRPVNTTRGFFDGRTLGDVRKEVKELLFSEGGSVGEWVRVPRCA